MKIIKDEEQILAILRKGSFMKRISDDDIKYHAGYIEYQRKAKRLNGISYWLYKLSELASKPNVVIFRHNGRFYVIFEVLLDPCPLRACEFSNLKQALDFAIDVYIKLRFPDAIYYC